MCIKRRNSKRQAGPDAQAGFAPGRGRGEADVVRPFELSNLFHDFRR